MCQCTTTIEVPTPYICIVACLQIGVTTYYSYGFVRMKSICSATSNCMGAVVINYVIIAFNPHNFLIQSGPGSFLQTAKVWDPRNKYLISMLCYVHLRLLVMNLHTYTYIDNAGFQLLLPPPSITPSPSSPHLPDLPVVLVLGLATTASAVHRLLPQSVSSLLALEQIHMQPASQTFTTVLKEVSGSEIEMHV